jgi:hypothetical protein
MEQNTFFAGAKGCVTFAKENQQWLCGIYDVFIPRHKSKRKFRFVYLRGPPFGRAIYSTRRHRGRHAHSLFHIHTQRLNLLHTHTSARNESRRHKGIFSLALFLQQAGSAKYNNFTCCGCKQKTTLAKWYRRELFCNYFAPDWNASKSEMMKRLSCGSK